MSYLKAAARRILEYSGTGSWIYTRWVLEWTKDLDVVRQLPYGIRFFCAYVRLHNRVVRTPTILLGHGVFHLTRRIDRKRTSQRQLQIGPHVVWLDLRDPGSLWAICELSTDSCLGTLIKKLVANADLFIDVGANQGIFSIMANTVMRPQARIIAIEPQPCLAECVRKSLASNPTRRGTVEQAVASDKSGFVSLFIPAENRGEAHISNPQTDTSLLKVRSITLDDLLGEVEQGTNIVIKMDVEGSELSALRGGANFLRNHRPTLILEINPNAMRRYNYSPADLASFLQEIGYDSWASVDDPTMKYPLDTTPATQCDIVLAARSIHA